MKVKYFETDKPDFENFEIRDFIHPFITEMITPGH